MADEKLKTRESVIEELTRESQARGFIEFPKMLYHPDGRQLTVTSPAEEQTALAGDWVPNPTAAQEVRAKRDALAAAEAANAAALSDAGAKPGKK